MEYDTIGKLLRRQYEKYKSQNVVAVRKKKLGIWKNITWDEFYEHIKYFSLGLASLGFKQEDKVCIVGNNDPEWLVACYGAMVLGGVLVTGGYVDSRAEELEYILNNSDTTVAVVEDQEQIDKMLEMKDKVPQLKKVIYWDVKGLRSYDDPLLMFYQDVLNLGREYEKAHQGFFEQSIEDGKGDDISIITYTSGTTGRPKGIAMAIGPALEIAYSFFVSFPTYEGDELVSYIPFAWPIDSVYIMYRVFDHGAIVNFPEEPETIEYDLREIGSRFIFVVPRLLEAKVRMVQAKMLDATALKRLAYRLLLPIGYRKADLELAQQSPNLFWRMLYRLCYLMLFRPLRDQLGYLKTRSMVSGGAALSPDIMRFCRALGIDIRNAYGLSEAGPICTIQRGNDVALEGVGTPISASVTVRIADTGEILLKSSGGMVGYYNDPEATAQVLDMDGFIHTGDAGFINERGQLVIIDRVVDLMKQADGTVFSPMYIENKLKFCPYIKDAIIVGDDRDYIGAFVAIDFANAGRWAEMHRIPYTTFRDLAQKPEVYELIRKDVERVNRSLPAATRIRKYALLQKELDADDAELTRSRKLRRGFVAKRYHDLVEAVYSNQEEYLAEFEVTYQDGRKMAVKSPMKVITV